MSNTVSDNPDGESRVMVFGHEVSLRGVIAVMMAATLCVVTFIKPDIFGKVFELTVTAVMGFYFGQKKSQ